MDKNGQGANADSHKEYLAEIYDLNERLEELENANKALLREKEEWQMPMYHSESRESFIALGRHTGRLRGTEYSHNGDTSLQDDIWFRKQRYRLLWQSASRQAQLSVAKTKIVLLYSENNRLKAKVNAAAKDTESLQASLCQAKILQDAQGAQLEQKKDAMKELREKGDMERAHLAKEIDLLKEELNCSQTLSAVGGLGDELAGTETIMLQDRVDELEGLLAASMPLQDRSQSKLQDVSTSKLEDQLGEVMLACSGLHEEVVVLQRQLKDEMDLRLTPWWKRLQASFCGGSSEVPWTDAASADARRFERSRPSYASTESSRSIAITPEMRVTTRKRP